jgi:hypothetical protein
MRSCRTETVNYALKQPSGTVDARDRASREFFLLDARAPRWRGEQSRSIRSPAGFQAESIQRRQRAAGWNVLPASQLKRSSRRF